uniref:Superoxide dismutase [Cu-Zn] n=1 Tax=Caligus clemensi TaxID=344056 RepID=C1C108_CALCM|nr:Superoxide dismutase [Caligus clemensi]
MKSTLFILAVLCFVVSTHSTYHYPQAQAVLYFKGDTSKPMGKVYFSETHRGTVIVRGSISGLSPGLHGFHIHEVPSLENECKGAGPHFNPFNQNHGFHSAERHVGDLGNIYSESNQFDTYFQKLDKGVSTRNGERDIIGRAVVVHAGEDDLGQGGNEESLRTGNAGARVACGIIVDY